MARPDSHRVDGWEAVGLYDLRGARATNRLDLLGWLADLGITDDQMIDALNRGQLNALAGDLALCPGRES